jgi:hypothetical protein
MMKKWKIKTKTAIVENMKKNTVIRTSPPLNPYRIGDVMVRVPVSCFVDRGFEPRSS